MKGYLSSTVTRSALTAVAGIFAVLFLAFHAGLKSEKFSISEISSMPTEAVVWLVLALLVAVGVPFFLYSFLGSNVVHPGERLVEISERVAAGDSPANLKIEGENEFALILDNFRRAVVKLSQSLAATPEVNATLQKSINQFLTVISQVARGDLTLRTKPTGDTLGHLAEALNSMLDSFSQVLERASKAASDVSGRANEILVASEQMASGATQQDQEITNTSSAVEELTVLDEAGVQQRGSQRRGCPPGPGSRRAGQPLRARYAGGHAANTCVRASHSKENQVPRGPVAGNLRNHQRDQRYYGADKLAGVECGH